MSILVGRDTRLVVQGITGREGEFHTRASIAYGTRVVAGTRPGKGGQMAIDGTVPIFDTVAEAVKQAGANTSVIYIPAAGAPDAILEAVDAGIATVTLMDGEHAVYGPMYLTPDGGGAVAEAEF